MLHKIVAVCSITAIAACSSNNSNKKSDTKAEDKAADSDRNLEDEQKDEVPAGADSDSEVSITCVDAIKKQVDEYSQAGNKTDGDSVKFLETRWKAKNYLVNEELIAVIDGTDLSAKFGLDGKVTGETGCNSFETTFKHSDGKIEFAKSIMQSKVACIEKANNQQEINYIKALRASVVYKVIGNNLVLLNDKCQVSATFLQ